jgi:hypothetical protein
VNVLTAKEKIGLVSAPVIETVLELFSQADENYNVNLPEILRGSIEKQLRFLFPGIEIQNAVAHYIPPGILPLVVRCLYEGRQVLVAFLYSGCTIQDCCIGTFVLETKGKFAQATLALKPGYPIKIGIKPALKNKESVEYDLKFQYFTVCRSCTWSVLPSEVTDFNAAYTYFDNVTA